MRYRVQIPAIRVSVAAVFANLASASSADGGVDVVVIGAAGVVVDDGLVVEIEDVERAVGADAGFNGAEPHVLAANELRLLAARLLVPRVAAALRVEETLVDEIDRGLGAEVTAVPR